MAKGTNKQSSGKGPKAPVLDTEDSKSGVKELHAALKQLSSTVSGLTKQFKTVGLGSMDLAKQVGMSVANTRDLVDINSSYESQTSRINDLYKIGEKRIQSQRNGLLKKSIFTESELQSLDEQLAKEALSNKNNSEAVKYNSKFVEFFEKNEKFNKLNQQERDKVLKYSKERAELYRKEIISAEQMNIILKSKIQRSEAELKLAELTRQELYKEFVAANGLKGLSVETVQLKFREKEILDAIAVAETDRTKAGQERLRLLQDELVSVRETFEIQTNIDDRLKKQTQELKKQEILHRSIDNLLEKSRGLLGDEGEEVLEIGKAIKESLVSPMALVGALIGNAVEEFGKIGRLGRELLTTTGLTVDQTEHLRHYAHDLSLEFRAQGVQLKDVLDAQAALVDQYGTVNRVTDEATEKVTLLGKAFGVPAQASAGVLYQLQKSTGASAKVAGNVAALGANFAKAAGVAPTAVFQDISQSSEQIAQYFKGTPADLMRTAVEARRLGLTLGKVADISKALLNFESSIEDQMTASVLLGREINLDKARQLAMEGKIEEAAKETLSQIGSLADFNKMNAVQKEAIAKAAGMTVGDLQQSLEKQEALKNMTAEQRAEYQKGLAALKSQNMTAAEKMLMDQRNQLTQEKIADAVAKISDIFANVILPVLEPIFDLISGIFNLIEPILPLLKTGLQIFLGWKAVSFVLNTNFFKMRGIFGTLLSPIEGIWKGLAKAATMTSEWWKGMGKGPGLLEKVKGMFTGMGGAAKKFFLGSKEQWKSWSTDSISAMKSTESKSKSLFGKLKEWVTGFSFGPMEKKADDLAQKMQESVTTAAAGATETLQDKAKGKVEEIVEDKKESAVESIQSKVEEKGKEIIGGKMEAGPMAGAVDKTSDVAKKGTKSEKQVGGSRAGEGIKTFFTNLAAGLKEMGQGGVAKGVLNTLIAGPAFIAFTLAAPGLFILQKIKGEVIQENLYALSYGLQDMAKKDVMKGAINLGISALGFVAMTAGVIGLGTVALLGVSAGVGLQGLAAGLKAMANPTVILGSVVLAGLAVSLGAGMLMMGAGVYFAAKGMAELAKQFKEMEPGQILATAGAFIGFAAAIEILAAAGVTATAGIIGLAGITGAILGLAYAVNITAPGISQIVGSFKELVSNIGGDKLTSAGVGLLSLAGGIGAVSVAAVGALIAVPAMAVVGVAVGTLGTVFSIAGAGFNFAAVGIQTATAALQSLTSSITKDSLISIADGLMSISKALGEISIAGILAGPILGALALAGPAISGVGSIFGENEPTKEPTTANTGAGTITETSTQVVDNSAMNEAILAKLDQLINVISNAKGELKINNSVMGEWIGLSTARNYKAVK